MTKLVEKAMEVFNRLPAERKDEVASMIIDVADETPYQLSPDEREAVERGIAAAEAGDFATDEQVAAVFRKLRSA